MAELRTIARPYAEAAFALASEEKSLAHWSESLSAMAQVVAAPEIQPLIGNPSVPNAKLVELIASATPSVSKSERDFLTVLADNERLLALPEISALYESLKNAAESVISAEVTSAFPMTEAQVADLTHLLEQKHGKKVKVSVVVDASLIGGVSIAIGDEVFDASVRGKLSRMATALTN
jgi:F-type H+-transporting ATPase subunit delta